MAASALGRSRRGSLARREAIEFYLCISPWLIGFIVFTAGPILASLVISLTDWDILTPANVVGLSNFVAETRDRLFWQSLKVTATYAFVSVPLHLVIGLFVAVLLNQPIRGVALWRTLYYLPSVISGVAVSLLWYWIFHPSFGVLNWLLGLGGIAGPAWLSSESWVMPALIVMSLWGVGSSIVINLAAIQGVPTELYEAAEIDGAGAWSRFQHVTLPMITPVLFFNLVLGVIGSFQTFTQAFVLTQGGPRYASLFYVLYLYQNAFQDLKMGYGAALAWTLFLIILGLTLLIFRSSPYWVYYEGQLRGRR
jgi:multiple sugar transport system permease protein